MFYLTKICMLFLVLLIWLVAYIDKCAPYWPIEISRTATGPIGKFIFPLGAVFLTIVSYFETLGLDNQWILLSPCLGFLIASFVHDEFHMPLHGIGVLLMCGGVTLNICYCFLINDPEFVTRACSFAFAYFLVGIYVFLKLWPVLDDPNKFSCWIGILKNPVEIANRCIKVNYHGDADEKTLRIYKVTGVLQWIIFSLILSTY